jgi:WD40 repeat protein/serine/threonine protein kinase
MAVNAARAKSLFLAASEIANPAERAAYLDRECGSDAELRARVAALLRANDAAPLAPDGPTEATQTHGPGRQPRTVDYGDPTARVGATLAGKYKLVEEIGEGGMGTVFMAQQAEPVKRAVAVKVIKAGMDSKAVLARFEAERQALAMMDHPNIAKVLDAGTTDGGRPFFVMELVKGTPITRYCDGHKLTPRQRLELFVAVCQAIQHAHQKGIIHRDIKPSNVLVAMYDDRPVPKVIDFGVAKAAGRSLTDKTLMSEFGAVIGTPEYMSPEQASLNNLDIDTRSDVYALGVLLYELLTGTTPVDRKSLGKVALLEILRIVREVEAPRPSAKLSTIDTLPNVAANRATEPAKLSRLMKGELDWLVMKALEKNRARRYETANALSRDIQRYLADEVVEARPPNVGYRMSKFVRRHNRQVLAASLLVLALVGGIVGTTLGLFEARRQEQIARDEMAEKEKARLAEAEQRRLAEANQRKAKSEEQRAVEARVQAEAARRETERQLRMGTALRLAAQSQSIHKDLPVQSLLLSVEAVEATRKHDEPVLPIAHESLRSAIASVGGHPLGGHEAGVSALEISSDGHWLVTAGRDNIPRLWNLTSPEPWTNPMLLRGHTAPVWSAGFSPDGRWLVTASSDKTARLWDLRQLPAAKLFELRGHQAAVTTFAFSPRSHWLATLARDNGVWLWDLSGDDPTTTGVALAGASLDARVELIVTADGPWIVAPQHEVPWWGGIRLWNREKREMDPKVLTHEGVHPAAISPDRRWLAAGIESRFGATPRVEAWDLTLADPSTRPKVIAGNEGRISAIAFTRDSHWLATAHQGAVHLWDLTAKDPTPGPRILDAAGGIYRLTISPDGHWLAAGGPDKTVRLWDLGANDVAAKHTLRGHEGSIHSLAISADNRWLVTGSGDHTARVWDLTAKHPEGTARELRGHEGYVDSIAIDRDHRWLVTASRQDPVPRLWDLTVEAPAEMDIVLRHTGQLFSMALSPNGRWLVARSSGDDGLRLWDIAGRDPASTLRILRGHDGPGIWSLGINSDNRWLATAGDDNAVRLWNLTAANPAAAVTVMPGIRYRGNVHGLTFSPDGHWLAAGAGDLDRAGPSSARVWDLTAGDPASTETVLPGDAGGVLSVAFSFDGHWLATGSKDEIRLWDLTAGKPADRSRTLPVEKGRVLSLAFSPNGRSLFARIASGGKPRRVSPREFVASSRLSSQVFDVGAAQSAPNGRLLGVYEEANAIMFDEVFSPDSRWLVTRTHVLQEAPAERELDAVVELWDLGTENPGFSRRVLFKGANSSRVWAFSPDSHWLVTEGAGGEVQLWDLTATMSGNTARVLRGHHVASAAFSSDSKWLATAGIDGTTRLWDLSAQKPGDAAVVLRDHSGSVRAVAISPDGRWLITGSDDRTIRLRDLRIGALIDLARHNAGRDLTTEEKQKYYLP